MIPSARPNGESECGSPLKMEPGTVLLERGPRHSGSPSLPSTLKKPQPRQSSMKVLEAKVASFTDPEILKASLTFSQASRHSVTALKAGKTGATPLLPVGDSSATGSKKGLRWARTKHGSPTNPCRTPDTFGQRPHDREQTPASLQPEHAVHTLPESESPRLPVHTQTMSQVTMPRHGNAHGAVRFNEDSSDEHSARRMPLVGKAIVRRASRGAGEDGAKSGAQSPVPRREVVRLARSPIFEQIEWPYGGTASWTSSEMRRTMQAHQKSMDSIA